MNRIRIVGIAGLCLLLSGTYCYAFLPARTHGPCFQLSGLWLGTYTYKNADDCKKSGACTHLLTAEIKRLSATGFQLDLSPPIDRHSTVSFICENGEISLPESPEHTVKFTCEKNAMCRIVYDDAHLGAVANRIK
ncbi:hypothetical protein [Aquicella siphonis]|nr:hypothetical protein [Aquicella siphonis]